MGTDNVNLYAKWTINQYTVTFDSQGGSSVPSQSVTHGNTIVKPTDPIKTSYTFAGWYKEATCINVWIFASETVTTPLTLYAKWIVTDNDGNVYTTITIGTQVWMVENLKTTKYNDNSAITELTSSSDWKIAGPAYCWYENDIANRDIYGALYNFYAVDTDKVAPKGWHIPTDAEWVTLINFLGGETVAGGKLKETGLTHWVDPNSGATNSSGFTALPGGARHGGGIFYGKTSGGNWWSSTIGELGAPLARGMSADSEDVGFYEGLGLHYGLSVRCIRD